MEFQIKAINYWLSLMFYMIGISMVVGIYAVQENTLFLVLGLITATILSVYFAKLKVYVKIEDDTILVNKKYLLSVFNPKQKEFKLSEFEEYNYSYSIGPFESNSYLFSSGNWIWIPRYDSLFDQKPKDDFIKFHQYIIKHSK